MFTTIPEFIRHSSTIYRNESELKDISEDII